MFIKKEGTPGSGSQSIMNSGKIPHEKSPSRFLLLSCRRSSSLLVYDDYVLIRNKFHFQILLSSRYMLHSDGSSWHLQRQFIPPEPLTM